MAKAKTTKRSRKAAKHPAEAAMRAIIETVSDEPDASSLVRTDFERYDLPAIANGRPFGWIVTTMGTHVIRVGQDHTSSGKAWVSYSADRRGLTAADIVDTFRHTETETIGWSVSARGAGPATTTRTTWPTVRGVYFWDGVGLVDLSGADGWGKAAERLDVRLVDAELAGLIANELAEAARYQKALDDGEYDGDGYWSRRRDEHTANAERIGEERRELGAWKD